MAAAAVPTSRTGAMARPGEAAWTTPCTSSRAVGRSAACLLSARRDRSARGPEKPSVSGGVFSTRCATAAAFPDPNGGRPVAAYATSAPHANTSSAVETGSPRQCSGLIHPGDPLSIPVRVMAVWSTARATPKSRTRGPSGDRMMFEGLRSRCAIPASWIWASASATPTARPRSSSPFNGPCLRRCSLSVMPRTSGFASQGRAASVSASSSGTAQAPPTRSSRSTSRAKRARKSSADAYSGWISLTAARRPLSSRAAYTRPMPPAPSRLSSR